MDKDVEDKLRDFIMDLDREQSRYEKQKEDCNKQIDEANIWLKKSEDALVKNRKARRFIVELLKG